MLYSYVDMCSAQSEPACWPYLEISAAFSVPDAEPKVLHRYPVNVNTLGQRTQQVAYYPGLQIDAFRVSFVVRIGEVWR